MVCPIEKYTLAKKIHSKRRFSFQFSSVQSLSRVGLFATPWTVAYQDPQSMGLSRQEYWSGLPFPSPGDLPHLGIKLASCLLHWQVDFFSVSTTYILSGFPGSSDSKASAYNERDPCLIPGSGRSPGEGNGNPLQYSGLKNSMDRGP